MPEILENIVSAKFMSKNHVFVILKITVTFALVYYLINFIEYENIKAALINADYRLIFTAFVLMGFNIYLQYKKWQLICLSVLNIIIYWFYWRYNYTV